MTPIKRDRDVEKTHSSRTEQGERDSLAERDQQDANLPVGPMREAIVDLQAPEEDPTIAADRAEAKRRGELAGDD